VKVATISSARSIRVSPRFAAFKNSSDARSLTNRRQSLARFVEQSDYVKCLVGTFSGTTRDLILRRYAVSPFPPSSSFFRIYALDKVGHAATGREYVSTVPSCLRRRKCQWNDGKRAGGESR